MRIWCQLPLQLEESDPQAKRFCEIIECDMRLAKRDTTEVTIVPLAHGIRSMEWMAYPGFRFFNEREIVRGCLQGEAEGYDGIMIANYFDSGLIAARQLCSKPVAGMAESSLLFASMMGDKCAVVVASDQFITDMEKTLDRCGLRSRAIDCRPVRSLSINYAEIMRCLLGEYDSLVYDFEQTARTCIRDGAEVIIAGGGLFSVMLTQGGVRGIDGVPVVDPFIVSLKHCEMMVDLQKAGLPVLSRKRLYYAPRPHEIPEAEQFFFRNAGEQYSRKCETNDTIHGG